MDWNVVRHLFGKGQIYAYLKATLDLKRINERHSKLGKTLLHYACQNRDDIAVRFLLSNEDIAVNATDAKGRNALHFAVQVGNCNIVRLLLAAGCNPLVVSLNNRNAMQACLWSGVTTRDEMLEVFIAYGMRIYTHLRSYVNFMTERTLAYEWHIQARNKRILILLALKRRRIPQMQHLDKFLVKELAFTLWSINSFE